MSITLSGENLIGMHCKRPWRRLDVECHEGHPLFEVGFRGVKSAI